MCVMRMGVPLTSNCIFTWAECAPLLCSAIMNEILIPKDRLYLLDVSTGNIGFRA